MHSLAELYKWHPALCGAILMAVANAGITTMPSPDDKSSKGYRWLFNFLHAIILAIPRLIAQYSQPQPAAKG